MSSWGRGLILLAFCALLGGAAFGQGFPFPAKIPGVDVVCNTTGCNSAQVGKKLVGYRAPFTTFVGRYADNVRQETWFYPVDTARTKWMWFAPERNRIYTVLGSTLFVYDMDTFFSRLAAGEPMVQISSATGLTNHSNGVETVLNPDRLFYPEDTWGSLGPDGDTRLVRVDWDDRGLVYTPAAAVGWGIVQDDGGKGGGGMDVVYYSRAIEPSICLSIKTSDGAYMLLVGDTSSIHLFNVTDPAHPNGSLTNVPGFHDFAKSRDGRRIALVNSNSGVIRIYNADTLARGGSPIVTLNGGYGNVTTDGVNFFSATLDSNYNTSIAVISPNAAGSYSVTSHKFTNFRHDAGGRVFVYTNPDAGGYLTMTTYEAAYTANNVRLFKMVNLVPTEVETGGYIARHYGKSGQAPGYTNPGTFSVIWESHVLKRGSRYYFILSDLGLGDVYEIRGSDAITAKVKSFGRTANPNSKAPANSGPVYGDEIKFTSEFSGTSAPSVTWNFGDNVLQVAPPSSPDITHQYGGQTAATLPVTYTVSAANAADSSMNHSISVTLARPAVRVGVLNTSILLTQATTDLTLPIISSDRFYDGSDGFEESHFAEWKLSTDAVSTKTVPSGTFGAGALGDRELTFTGHYGPYNANFIGASDAAFSIAPIRYKVRAFAPVVAGPFAGGANVSFRNATRVTTNTADLPGGAATVVEYTWDLINEQGARVGNPVTGNAALSAIPDFTLPRSTFAGAQNWKARLGVKLNAAIETALSSPLNGPTPGAINANGCTNAGSPCTLTVPSTVAANDPSTWTYNWTVTGPVAVGGGTSPAFSPAFTQAGTYTVTVNISNALGDAAPLSKTLTIGQALCSSTPTNATTAIAYKGRTSGCIANFNTRCGVSETIDFWFNNIGWTPQECDKYTWNFGDGTAAATQKMPAHAYNANGTYTVTLFIDGGASDATVTSQVTVGTVDQPTCGEMVPQINVYANYTGAVSGCNSITGNCDANEVVTFRPASNGYNYACGPHSFVWNFGDGTAAVTTTDPAQAVTHTYASAGTWPLTVEITSSRPQTVTVRHDVRVSDRVGTSCGTMSPGLNVSIGYSGPTSGCSAVGGSCASSEAIAFTLATLGYNLGCAPHTFLWTFGDGATSAQQNATHAYAAAGNYDISLKITRSDNATVTLQRTVRVAPTGCPAIVPGQNLYVVFEGQKSGCTSNGGDCQEDEEIAFAPDGFDFSCGAHTFLWIFGDGTTSNIRVLTHAFKDPGTYNVTLKVMNSQQTVEITKEVKVASKVTKRRASRH